MGSGKVNFRLDVRKFACLLACRLPFWPDLTTAMLVAQFGSFAPRWSQCVYSSNGTTDSIIARSSSWRQLCRRRQTFQTSYEAIIDVRLCKRRSRPRIVVQYLPHINNRQQQRRQPKLRPSQKSSRSERRNGARVQVDAYSAVVAIAS